MKSIILIGETWHFAYLIKRGLLAKECAEPPSYAVFNICIKDTSSYQFEGYSLCGTSQITSEVIHSRVTQKT